VNRQRPENRHRFTDAN